MPSLLNQVAFAYQPVWDRSRRVCAVRLVLHALQPRAVDVVPILTAVTEGWSSKAPPLFLSTDEPPLLVQILKQAPVANTWVEVPEGVWAKPEALELLLNARKFGHQLLWKGPLARFAPYAQKFKGLRGMLDVSIDDAVQALQSAQQGGEFSLPAHVQRIQSPILPGQFYTGVSSRALADHALDRQQASGLAGWPDAELLKQNPHVAIPPDRGVMQQVVRAIDAEAAMPVLSQLLLQDPVLVYRLLRMVNSAAFGLSHEVVSIKHAVMMMGYNKLRQWLQGLMPTGTDDKAWHPVRQGQYLQVRLMALLLGPNNDDALQEEVQLAGALSQLDVWLKTPLPELLHALPLPEHMYHSLVRLDGPYTPYLDMARALGEPEQLGHMPVVCSRAGFALDDVNRAVIQLAAMAREPVAGPAPLGVR